MTTTLPAWMLTARACIGVKEYAGAQNNPLIMRWATRAAKFLGIKYDGDHVPWCGLFTAYCVIENGIIPPSIAVRASAWSTWGVPLVKPAFGALMTFSRKGGNHVGFYVSEDETTYHILGGNQSDAVNVTRIAKTRLTAIRWPSGRRLPTTGPITAKLGGRVSNNEA